MAEIISARFVTPAEDQVEAALDDGTTRRATWPGSTAGHRKLQDWVDAGGTIDPYSKPPVTVKDEMGVEARRRITNQVPAWNSQTILDVIESIWGQLGSKTAAQDMARQIFQYAKQSAAKVDGLTPADAALVVATDDLPFAAVDAADLGWPDTRA